MKQQSQKAIEAASRLAREAGEILQDKNITEIERFKQITKLIFESHYAGYDAGLDAAIATMKRREQQ